MLRGAAALALLAGRAARAATPRRLVTLGGAVTETVFALGAGAEVVGVDASSSYPAEATSRAQVGYYRQISAEGVLALGPTDVLAPPDTGPAAAVSQLRAAGVRLHALPEARDSAGAEVRILAIGAALGRDAEASALAEKLRTDFAETARYVASRGDRPRVLFIYARGAGTVNVAGAGTAADEMLRLAGATNAAADLQGYKPLTPEAALAAAPDHLLFTTHGLTSVGGADAAWTLPGLALTPAGRTRALLTADDLELLGFGPRAGSAALRLARALRAQR
jgi:iron complex transport system substrate-binding protein